MPSTYSDNFNRADAQPPGADYANMPSINTFRAQILSNQLAADSSGSTSAEYLNPGGSSVFPVDVRVELDVAATVINTGERVEVFTRLVNPALSTVAGYRLRVIRTGAGYDYMVMSRNGGTGTLTTYATVAGALTAGDKLGFQVVGAAPGGILKIERFTGGSWSTVVSYTTQAGDADQFSAAGAVGFAINGSPWRLDNLAVTDLTVTGATFTKTGLGVIGP